LSKSKASERYCSSPSYPGGFGGWRYDTLVKSAAATVIGFGLGFTGIDAIHMLVWSAVLNGIVAVPIMAMMMVITCSWY
jgi:hypothetical protein